MSLGGVGSAAEPLSSVGETTSSVAFGADKEELLVDCVAFAADSPHGAGESRRTRFLVGLAGDDSSLSVESINEASAIFGTEQESQ